MYSLIRILYSATRREWIAYRRTFAAICFMLAALSALTVLLSPSTAAQAGLFTILTTSGMTILVTVTLATEMWTRDLSASSSLARRLPGGLGAMACSKLLFYGIVQAAALLWGAMVGIAAGIAVAGPESLASVAADLPLSVLPAMSIATLGPWIGAVTLWGAEGILAIPGVLFLFAVSGVPVFATLGEDAPQFIQALHFGSADTILFLMSLATSGALVASITLIRGRRFDRRAAAGACTGLSVVALLLIPTYTLAFGAVRNWEAATPDYARFQIHGAVLAPDGARIWVNTRSDKHSPWSCSVIRTSTGEIRRLGGRGEMVRSPTRDYRTATSPFVLHVDREGNPLAIFDSSSGRSLPESALKVALDQRHVLRLPDGSRVTIEGDTVRSPLKNGKTVSLPWYRDATPVVHLGFGVATFRRGRITILDFTRGRTFPLPQQFVDRPSRLFELRILRSGSWFIPTGIDDQGRALFDPDTGTLRDARGWKPFDLARGLYGKNGLLVVNERPGKHGAKVVILDPETGQRDAIRLPSSSSMFRFRNPAGFFFGVDLGPNRWLLDVGPGFAVLDLDSMSIGEPLLADALIGRVGESFFALAGRKTIYQWKPLTGELRAVFPR